MFRSPRSSAWGSVHGDILPTVLTVPQTAHNAVIGVHLVTVHNGYRRLR